MRYREGPMQGTGRLASGRTSMVPFLPTLATAFAIAGLSLFCREPQAPAPVAPAASMTMAAEAAPAAAPARERVEWPASLLLAQLPPPAMTEPAPTPVRVANRRSCAGARCETRRSLAARPAQPPVVAARQTPEPVPVVAQRYAPEPERTGTLPEEAFPDAALPFVPGVDRVWDAARNLGGRVVAIGSSVSDVLPSLN